MSIEEITNNREYFITLLFHNNNIDELQPGNNWSINAGYNNNQLEFTEFPSRFNSYSGFDYQTLSIKDANVYLYNDRIIDVRTDYYTLSFWCRFDLTCIELLSYSNTRYIPGFKWEDNNGKTCTIDLLKHVEELNNTLFLVITISNYRTYLVPYDYVQPDHWFHIVYSRENNIDRVFIDGRKRYETVIDKNKANKNIFKNIYIGNPYDANISGSFNYGFDEITLCNDVLFRNDFDIYNPYTFWLYPEVNHVMELDQEIEQINYINSAPNFYNVDKTRIDKIYDKMEITRPSYWKEKDIDKLKMMNKHKFWNNTYSQSNFKTIDKLNIK